MKTRKNKLMAVLLVAVGAVPAVIYGDAGVLVFCLMIAIPLFFAKENYIL